MIQLDFFEKETQPLIWEEMRKINNMLRGLFARYNELERIVIDLQVKKEENEK